MIADVTMRRCMEFAVGTEDIGAKYYARLAKRFAENSEISELFEQLGNDETVHKQQFSQLLNNLPPETDVSNAPEKTQYVRGMSVSEFFSRHHGPFQNVDRIENRDDALETALEFEKATLGFYRSVEEVLGQNATLSQVIETEKRHIANITKAMLVEGSRFRGLQDDWP